MRFLSLLFVMLLPWARPAAAQTPFWEQATGPYGGTAVAAFTALPGGAVLAAVPGGLFRSDDGGNTWYADDFGLKVRDVRALVTLPDGTVFAGTHGDGVYRRRDGSPSWLGMALPRVFVTALAADAEGRVYAATTNSLFRTDDRGETWTEVDPTRDPRVRTQALAANVRYVFAATSQGIYRSGDGGAHWTFIGTGLSDLNVTTLAADPQGTLYAGTAPLGASGALYRSRNDGNLWIRLALSPDPRQLYAVASGPSGTLYAGGYRYLYRSEDGGDTWQWSRIAETTVQSLLIGQTGRFAGTAGRGILRAHPGGQSWHETNEGIPSTLFDLHLTPEGILYAATAGGVYRSADRGRSWALLNDGLTTLAVRSLTADGEGRLVAGTYNGAFRLGEDGATWTDISPPDPPALRDLTPAPDGSLYAGFYAGIYRLSRTGLGGWTRLGLRGPDGADRDVIALAIDDAGALYAGSYYDAFRLDDTGWSRIGLNDSTFFGVQAFATDGASVYAGTRYFGVLRSDDRGEHWQRLDGGLLGNEDFQTLAFDDRGRLHGGTYGAGIFRLNASTNRWAPFNDGLTDLRVVTLAFDGAGNAYAGTVGSGLFVHREGGTAVSDPARSSPTTLRPSLYPNPVRDAATFHWSLPTSGLVRLSVHDLLGRTVAVLHDGPLSAGEHTTAFDAGSLPAGVYFYRLLTPSAATTGRFVHVR